MPVKSLRYQDGIMCEENFMQSLDLCVPIFIWYSWGFLFEIPFFNGNVECSNLNGISPKKSSLATFNMELKYYEILLTELLDLVYICNSFYKERCNVNSDVILFYWCIGLFYL